MGDKSRIEWTDATWNPIVGCTHVSPGCDHCYAAALHNRRYLAWKRGAWPDAPLQYRQPFKRVQLLPERLDVPLRWSRPRRVFVNSLSDLFHEDVPEHFIDSVFAVMAAAGEHTFQVLTKRPERMRDYLTTPDRDETIGYAAMRWYEAWSEALMPTSALRIADALPLIHRQGDYARLPASAAVAAAIGRTQPRWPLPNVWLGVSVEDQARADERVPLLLETPAAVRFLSCEPLLGEVSLIEYIAPTALQRCIAHHHRTNHPCGGGGDSADCEVCGTEWVDGEVGLHWVIAGGESGPRHRPLELDHARLLRDQCAAAGVRFLFKQVGGRTSKAGGRELDGRTWDEYPAVRS